MKQPNLLRQMCLIRTKNGKILNAAESHLVELENKLLK
jgi:hypothetical protein